MKTCEKYTCILNYFWTCSETGYNVRLRKNLTPER